MNEKVEIRVYAFLITAFLFILISSYRSLVNIIKHPVVDENQSVLSTGAKVLTTILILLCAKGYESIKPQKSDSVYSVFFY